jgi:hypothetical protein
MGTRSFTILAGLTIAPSPAATQTRNTIVDSVSVITSDVTNFWRAYDRLTVAKTRADSVRAITDEYFQPASRGLAEYVRIRLKRPENILDALRMAPRYYAAVRANTLRLNEEGAVIREGFLKFQALYPAAVFPDIYFFVVGFISQGVSRDNGLYIGAEMVAADSSTPVEELPAGLRIVDLSARVVPCIAMHELVHYQQHYAPGESLLKQALVEGVADFLAIQTVGCTATANAVYAYGEAHEEQLWAEFRATMDGTEFGKWFYNGDRSTDRPANLGYWIGYKIAAAYYRRSSNKPQAVDELLHIRDFHDVLARSGYEGGRH